MRGRDSGDGISRFVGGKCVVICHPPLLPIAIAPREFSYEIYVVKVYMCMI